MTARKALNGKPYAGNPYMRTDEGAGASKRWDINEKRGDTAPEGHDPRWCKRRMCPV